MVYCVHGRTMMKRSVAVLLILFGVALAKAQNQAPIWAGSHPNRHPASSQKSLSSGAVAAVLNRKSKTASDLAKIEQESLKNSYRPATTHASAPKNFGVGQDNRNKPMKASRPGGLGRSTYHPKTKTG